MEGQESQHGARRWRWALIAGLAVGALAPGIAPAASRDAATTPASTATVWLCRPGLADDPCTSSQTTTVVSASGSLSVLHPPIPTESGVACFYVYPTVSTEGTENADLKVQQSEIAAAVSQASPFSRVCQVYAPIYRQVTLRGLAAAPTLDVSASANAIAYDSIRSGFEAFLRHGDAARPIVVIGHSQGAAMLILLLRRLVDDDPGLRRRLLMAIILGGNVEIPTGKLVGATFSHLPLCDRLGESGCVIAYSSFPGEPPKDALFGRPGQGVSLQSDQHANKGVSVACVNPAALGGGSGLLDPLFPSDGRLPTPWAELPGLYRARCEQAGGASWLDVAKATGASDPRPVIKESDGPAWGYHSDDVNLALGNLVADVAAAEHSWKVHH